MNRSRDRGPRGGEPDDLSTRGEELRNMFNRARAFTEELLRENERLRFRVSGLEREVEQAAGKAPTPAPESVAQLTERLRALEQERDDLLARFRQVEAMNRSVAARYENIETQNSHLANLYVASYQLHATLNFSEVLDTVREILINLIGAEGFAVFWVDDRTGHLKRELSQGMGTSVPERMRPGKGPLLDAVDGQSYYADPLPDTKELDPARPIACIPLKIGTRVIGVIAIYLLLQQKDRFKPLDFELFTLLAGHAATALFSSKLYQRSEKKLSELQGFLDLLTAPTSPGS
jgi:GAF domain-containing protein